MLIIVAIYGLIVGSFLNALVWRLKKGKSIAKGRSICPHCRHVLSPFDLVPVLSWITLRGNCRYCNKSISIQYPLVELATAVLFGLSYLALRPQGVAGWVEFIVWLVVLAGSIALTVYDLRWFILPDAIVIPLTGLVLAALVVGRITHVVSPEQITSHVMAALITGGAFYLLASIGGGKLMGGGDVKLAFLIGLVLGGTNTLIAMFIGFDTAAVVGILLIATGIKNRKDHLPFGPFLIAGMIAAHLYAPQILAFYNGVINQLVA